jgi:hypothetical protein
MAEEGEQWHFDVVQVCGVCLQEKGSLVYCLVLISSVYRCDESLEDLVDGFMDIWVQSKISLFHQA